MRLTTLSRAAAAMLVGLLLVVPEVVVLAQTATTTTTITEPITTTSAQTVIVASATDVEVGGFLFIDRELMQVTAVSGTTAAVIRGVNGIVEAHVDNSPVFAADKNQAPYVFINRDRDGGCTRANEQFLPQINPVSGAVWDCPVGLLVWANLRAVNTARSEAYNLDNGAGVTIDSLLIRHPRAIAIVGCRIVYEDATTGTVAAGNAKVGTTVGGAEIVAATAYANAAAVGARTAMTIVEGKVGADVAVLVRHTGVAITQAGEAVVECDYVVR